MFRLLQVWMFCCEPTQVWCQQPVHSSCGLVPGEEPAPNTTPRWAGVINLSFIYVHSHNIGDKLKKFNFELSDINQIGKVYIKRKVLENVEEFNKMVAGRNDCFFFPPDYPDPGQFSWSRYLEETGSKAVAPDAFKVVRITPPPTPPQCCLLSKYLIVNGQMGFPSILCSVFRDQLTVFSLGWNWRLWTKEAPVWSELPRWKKSTLIALRW